MNAIVPVPKFASTLKALLAAFSEQTYFSLVLSHDLAAELGSEQIATAYHSGSWPAQDWAQQSLARARVDRRLLKRSVFMSATLAGLLALLALLVAIILGTWKSAFVIARGPWEVPGGRWSMAFGVGCIPVALSGAPQLSLQFATRDRSRHAAQSAALRWHSLRGRGRPVVAMRPNHLSSGLREKPRSPLTSTLNLHFE